MKQITSNVYAEDRFSVPPNYRGCNPAFVATSAGVVMLDTPMMPSDAIKWRDTIAEIGEVCYIVNTHHHVDHITGNSFFGGKVVSHEGVKKLFIVPMSVFAGDERPNTMALVGQGTVGYIRKIVSNYDVKGMYLLDEYEPKPPAITFTSGKLILYVGKHIFELIHLPGHTENHIGIYIPQEKIFFAGDNITGWTQPSMAYSLPLQWIDSLKRIEELDIEYVIPGHGEICRKREVRAFRRFIQRCIDMVREAIQQGMSKEQAVEKLSFEGLDPGGDRGSVHPGSYQQRANVLRLYEMLS